MTDKLIKYMGITAVAITALCMQHYALAVDVVVVGKGTSYMGTYTPTGTGDTKVVRKVQLSHQAYEKGFRLTNVQGFKESPISGNKFWLGETESAISYTLQTPDADSQRGEIQFWPGPEAVRVQHVITTLTPITADFILNAYWYGQTLDNCPDALNISKGSPGYMPEARYVCTNWSNYQGGQ
ncbi:MAG: hypothetical protein OXC91_10675 [Rhodobacteraceae bacterium]|nr:hypothetical protein [Paracoccaceae bacterium]